jgi:hypothetical protein
MFNFAQKLNMSCISKELNNVLDNKYGYDEFTKLKLLEVLFLTADLFKEYRINDTEFAFSNHFGAYGTCHSNGELITLLLNHAIKSDMAEIKNTLLHEIVHVLVGIENGHNEVWQEQAKKMDVKLYKNYRK